MFCVAKCYNNKITQTILGVYKGENMKNKVLAILIAIFVLSVAVLTLAACGDPPHTHNYATLKHDNASHWYECVCGDKATAETHSGGTATCTTLAECSVCHAEYGTLEQHSYVELKTDATQHWYECVCGDNATAETHSGGTATCTNIAE